MKSLLLFHVFLLLLFSSSEASRLPLDGVVKVLHTLLARERDNQSEGAVNQFHLSPSFTEAVWPQLQKLLTDSLVEHGLRLKRSTNSDWDLELDLTSFGLHGVLFQLKYLDPPMAKVHMNLRGAIGMLRYVCTKLNLRCDLPDDLEVDLFYDGINSKIWFKSQKTGWGDNWYKTEIDSFVSEGVYILKIGDRVDMNMYLEWPLVHWMNAEKTTEVFASVSGGPSCDLDIRAVFTGSWSKSHFGESVLTEVTWNGAKWSALLSNDKSGSRWTLRLVRPSEHWTSGEPDPAYTYTFTFQDGGFLVTGSLNDLGMGIPWTSIGFNPWTLLGYRPWDTEGGQWMLHVNFTIPTLVTSNETLLEMDARVSNSEKELNILKFKVDGGSGDSSPPQDCSSQCPSLFNIRYKVGNGRRQTFNKADLLIDDHRFEVKAINEKEPRNGAFNYKFRYERKSSGRPIVHTLKYASLIHIECPSCPRPYIEELSGNYTFTDLNPDQFELTSLEKFVSDYRLPFFKLFSLLGIGADKSKLPRTVIQFDVSRVIVLEKPKLLLSFGNVVQSVDVNGARWHQLIHRGYSNGTWGLRMSYLPQDSMNEEVWTYHFKNKHRDGSSFHFENGLTLADKLNTEIVLFWLETSGSLNTYPRTELSWKIELKKGRPGGENSVFLYQGDIDLTTKRDFIFNTKEFISQTEHSPFYEAGRIVFGKHWQEANITRGVHYNNRGHASQPFNFFGLFIFPLGSLDLHFLVTLDKERFCQLKIDTRRSVGQILWYHQPIRGLLPITRDLVGQDELKVNLWQYHKLADLTFKTNLPQLQTFSTRNADGLMEVEINGNTVVRFDTNPIVARPNHLSFITTILLHSGKSTSIKLWLPANNFHSSYIEAKASFGHDRNNFDQGRVVVQTQFHWNMAEDRSAFNPNLAFSLGTLVRSCEGGDTCASLEVEGEGCLIIESRLGQKFSLNTTCEGELCNGFGVPLSKSLTVSLADSNQFLVSSLWKYSAEENLNGYELNIQPTTTELIDQHETFYNASSNETVIMMKLKSFGQFPAYMMLASLTGVLSTFIGLKYLGFL